MAHLDRAFRDLLDAFLDRSGTSGRRFGVEALGDPGFVASLRRGRRLGLRTADRLLAFMGFAPVGPAFRREVEAFLRATGTKAYLLGELALADPSFVERLRRGASFRLSTVERVRAWMAGQACAAARAAMRAAVAGVPLLGEADDDTPQGDCDMTHARRRIPEHAQGGGRAGALAPHARPLPRDRPGAGLSPLRPAHRLPPRRPRGLGRRSGACRRRTSRRRTAAGPPDRAEKTDEGAGNAGGRAGRGPGSVDAARPWAGGARGGCPAGPRRRLRWRPPTPPSAIRSTRCRTSSAAPAASSQRPWPSAPPWSARCCASTPCS